MEQKISSAKIKPDRATQNFDKIWAFDGSDDTEIRLLLLHFLNILEYIWWLLNSDL